MNIQDVRDFIYIDINRVSSIVSQLEEGLINETQTMNGNSGSLNVGGQAKVPLIGAATAEAGLQIQSQLLETKSPHDYIYNKVESLLLKEKRLLRIPNGEDGIFSLKLRKSIGNTSFVLTKGKVSINDFNQLLNFLDNYDQLSEYIAKGYADAQENLNQTEKNLVYDKKLKEFKSLDNKTRKGISCLINTFYRGRVIIKIIPFRDYPNFRFVGNINRAYLRDDLESIVYKYGTSPLSDWNMFCQIASVPPEIKSNEVFDIAGNPIESAFQKIFDAYRNLESIAQSVSYPEIAVTPIAIYRE